MALLTDSSDSLAAGILASRWIDERTSSVMRQLSMTPITHTICLALHSTSLELEVGGARNAFRFGQPDALCRSLAAATARPRE